MPLQRRVDIAKKKVTYNQIEGKDYLGIFTVFDYEISVRKYLSNIRVSTYNKSQRKIIVDMALKAGMNEYRFVAYDVTDDGMILCNACKYITPCEDIIRLANSFIRKRGNILPNSMLSSATQNSLFRS